MSILVAIVTSLIASIVFYVVFQLIPEKIKYHKIRPRIEVELMEIADSLYHYLAMPFCPNLRWSPLLDDEMKKEFLGKNDFELGLYNKCLNESYLFDENKDKLVVAGHFLQKQTNEISTKIHQVLLSQHFLTSEEILIIEDIDRLLHTHIFDSNATDRIGAFIIRPVNPTLSYMCHNFYKIYQLWIELRHVIFRYTVIKKEQRQGAERFFNLKWNYIKLLVANKKYKEAEKEIKKWFHEKITPFQEQVLWSFGLQINLEKACFDQAKFYLKKILTDFHRDNLIYMRGFLNCIIDNEDMMKLCSSLCSAEEINEWLKVVERERKQKEAFLSQNQKLREYYEIKKKNQPRLT